jgi:hypothetical protein
MLAFEESYELDDKGEPLRRTLKLRTLPNVLYAFKLYAKYNCEDFTLDTSENGWNQLRSMFKVRDRLMHPKTLTDIQVNDAEIIQAVEAFHWFINQFGRMLVKSALSWTRKNKILKEQIRQTEEETSKLKARFKQLSPDQNTEQPS